MWGTSQNRGENPLLLSFRAPSRDQLFIAAKVGKADPGTESGVTNARMNVTGSFDFAQDDSVKKLTPAPIRLRSGQALAGVTNAGKNVTGSFTLFRMTSWRPV